MGKETDKIEFAGPSEEMVDALEEAGLNIAFPTEVQDREELAIDGEYCTSQGWHKYVLVDLRDEQDLSTTKAVDKAVAAQLQDAYDCFSVDNEMAIVMSLSKKERELRGFPEVDEMIADMQDAKAHLHLFADVAEAVVNGNEIPR